MKKMTIQKKRFVLNFLIFVTCCSQSLLAWEFPWKLPWKKEQTLTAKQLELQRKQIDDPNDPYINYNVGVAAYKKKQFDDAAASFERALIAADTKPIFKLQAHYNLAKTHHQRALNTVGLDWEKQDKIADEVIDKAVELAQQAVKECEAVLVLDSKHQKGAATKEEIEILIQKLLAKKYANQQPKDQQHNNNGQNQQQGGQGQQPQDQNNQQQGGNGQDQQQQNKSAQQDKQQGQQGKQADGQESSGKQDQQPGGEGKDKQEGQHGEKPQHGNEKDKQGANQSGQDGAEQAGQKNEQSSDKKDAGKEHKETQGNKDKLDQDKQQRGAEKDHLGTKDTTGDGEQNNKSDARDKQEQHGQKAAAGKEAQEEAGEDQQSVFGAAQEEQEGDETGMAHALDAHTRAVLEAVEQAEGNAQKRSLAYEFMKMGKGNPRGNQKPW